MKKLKYILSILALFFVVLAGCKNEDDVFEDPYSGAKESLGVSISRDLVPEPMNGSAGTSVVIKASGLMPYKEKLKFLFNGVEAKVISVTETEITVEVPENASSGVTSIVIDNQVVVGPEFTVDGLVNIDPTFLTKIGTNRQVNQYYRLSDNRNILVGAFTDYDNKGLLSPLNRILRIDDNGGLDRTFRPGRASNGDLSSFVEFGNRYIIAGGFSGYGIQGNISNITALSTNGSIDTLQYDTYMKNTTGIIKYFPSFNGGTNSYIDRLYTFDNKLIATGNFRYYIKRIYDQPNYLNTKDSVILDSTEIRQVIRLGADGALDKTYRFNPGGVAFEGANGYIDSYMHTSGPLAGKLVIFGKFSRFDGQAAKNIIRLNADGTIDNTFNPGNGTDNAISSLKYNPDTDQYLITGSFRAYGGHDSPGIAMLKSNGEPVNTFTAKPIVGGYATFAKQLSSGLIVVAGNFRTYGGIFRSGFMILEATGELAAGYNNTGRFSGNLRDVIETKSADDKKALLLIGAFNKFDNVDINNIVRITIE
ncbi:MAG TPA: DUF5008 domain-containing protein [Pelobium sp.]|nr:DUF5008 domain-containing protein [Pelobium sp.]